jgi:glycosyltransferase involved in cell wall biosynthesis
MPAYNAGEYINESVGSILEQSYTNWELIIVNDGSTDNTLIVLETIKDDRIYIVNQENKGQCNAANKAFSLSNGSLIKFMDADDMISPNFIENQVKNLHGEIDAIATASWGRFYHHNLNTFKLDTNIIQQNITPIDWLIQSMDNGQAMMQCALWLIPRNLFKYSGLWDEGLSLINDFEFFIRVLLCAREVIFTENAILYYRSDLKNSLSKLKSRKGAESAYNSINKGTSHMLQYENCDRVKKVAANCFQDFVYTFYPKQSDLIYDAEKRIKDLGGSSLTFPTGGYTKICQFLVGWKLTKRIKILFNY